MTNNNFSKTDADLTLKNTVSKILEEVTQMHDSPERMYEEVNDIGRGERGMQ